MPKGDKYSTQVNEFIESVVKRFVTYIASAGENEFLKPVEKPDIMSAVMGKSKSLG